MSNSGIHHVTAISGSAPRNADFYRRVLGLRLVKKTVNFDDPGTYHLYYGDEAGRPGTILTFFPWEHVAPGRVGIGQTSLTSFKVPKASIGYWTHRFVQEHVPHDGIGQRFGETILTFKDPDGMPLALVGVEDAEDIEGWSGGPVPAEHAIRGFHGVTLLLADGARTAGILTDVFGMKALGKEGHFQRFGNDSDGVGNLVDLHIAGNFLGGSTGGGSVHHVAFRAENDAEQEAMTRKLIENHRIRTTEQLDRNYFRSVYFREPGGILFEIATNDPGFAVDEPAETLGQSLKLPRFLEPRRREIEGVLPPID
ncbi:glyoxalase family protein [Rhodoligotrophos appendicifer]|uniref:ring-cleaving dioxygenase n=1 Tax=Rhodoligotrophos appendicifer TaxID=987056 RepID=UPI001180E1DA|nr:ring-cleaving dioxygenase [Rhodoligotrophos appendicifer]